MNIKYNYIKYCTTFNLRPYKSGPDIVFLSDMFFLKINEPKGVISTILDVKEVIFGRNNNIWNK